MLFRIRAKITEIISHPNYNGNTYDMDFALLKLKNKIDFSANSHIRPVSIKMPLLQCGGFRQMRSHLSPLFFFLRKLNFPPNTGSYNCSLYVDDAKVITEKLLCNYEFGDVRLS